MRTATSSDGPDPRFYRKRATLLMDAQRKNRERGTTYHIKLAGTWYRVAPGTQAFDAVRGHYDEYRAVMNAQPFNAKIRGLRTPVEAYINTSGTVSFLYPQR